jgi:hypothetical protein
MYKKMLASNLTLPRSDTLTEWYGYRRGTHAPVQDRLCFDAGGSFCFARFALADRVRRDEASAQTYYFNFSSQDLSFMATINGLTCNPSCTLTQPSNLSGTETFPGNQYSMVFSPMNIPGSISTPDDLFNVNTGVDTNGITYKANGVIFDVFQHGGEGTAGVEQVEVESDGGSSGGTLTYGLTSTPAPIPGSGLLSYLALGLGGLFFYRKRLWRAAPKGGRKGGLGLLCLTNFVWAALRWSHLSSINQRHDIRHFPKPFRHPGFHRGRDAKRFVNAAEIIKHREQSNGTGVIFQLL